MKANACYLVTYLKLLPILFFGCLASCSSPQHQSLYINSLSMSAQDYLTDFEELHGIVKRRHTHLSHKAINLDSLYTYYAGQVAAATDNETYGKLVLAYFAGMQNGHTDVFFRRYALNANAKLIENRLFIADLTDERLLHQGVQANDEILAIDNVPALDWLEQEKALVGASTAQGLTYKTVSNNVFMSYFATERLYLVKTATGETKRVKVKFDAQHKFTGSKLPILYSNSLSDSVGYIAINAMKGDVVAKFSESYQQLCTKPYLIVDVRQNGGGNSGFSEQIIAHLLKQSHRASVSRRLLKPTENAYKGKLIVLTSGHTFSAAESFVIDLTEGAAAIVVGEPTAGDTGNGATLFSTSQGVVFRVPTRSPRFSAGGFPMEGRSIQPAHVVQETIADFVAGKDTALHFALTLLTQTAHTTAKQAPANRAN